MAESLQCPSCGAHTRVGSPPPDTVTCGRCGRGLKLSASSNPGVAPPPRARRRGGSAAEAPPVTPDPAAAGGTPRGEARAVSSGAAAPPAPRRRRGGADPGTAVLPKPEVPVVTPAASAGPVTITAAGADAPPARQPSRDSGAPSRLVRILVWVVALPIALVAVGLPARKAGYLTGQKLLDVIVKHDLGRFVPLVVIVALWALATAVLVTLLLALVERFSHRGGAPDDEYELVGAGRSRGSRRTP